LLQESAVNHSAISIPLRHVGRATLLAVVYFVVAKLSLLTAIPPGYATSVWPPSGLALAAILLVGNRVWPGIWIGAALANLTVASSPVASILIGSGNALEALAAAALIRRFIGTPRRFERGEDVFKFVAIAAVASMIAATIGTVSIAADGAIAWTEFRRTGGRGGREIRRESFSSRPLILVPALGWSGKWSTQHKIELVAFAIALALAGFIAFGSVTTASGFSPLLLVLTLPLGHLGGVSIRSARSGAGDCDIVRVRGRLHRRGPRSVGVDVGRCIAGAVACFYQRCGGNRPRHQRRRRRAPPRDGGAAQKP
jgi:integral membrane sensor domain MASE1